MASGLAWVPAHKTREDLINSDGVAVGTVYREPFVSEVLWLAWEIPGRFCVGQFKTRHKAKLAVEKRIISEWAAGIKEGVRWCCTIGVISGAVSL